MCIRDSGTDAPNPGGVSATECRRSATAATGLSDADARTDRRAASPTGVCRADVTSAEARDPTRETVDPEDFTPRPPRPAAARDGELSSPDTAPGSAGPADTDVESVAEVSAAATPNACGPASYRPTTTAAAPTPAPLTTLNAIPTLEFLASAINITKCLICLTQCPINLAVAPGIQQATPAALRP